MKRTYSCPHCDGDLNPGTKIILRGESGKQRGLFLFSPQPGDYHVVVPEGFKLKKKDRVDFSCPICSKSLSSKRDKSMAEIRFTMPGSNEGTVAFSKIYGQHATYFITAEHVKHYGAHRAEAVNFFGEGPDVG